MDFSRLFSFLLLLLFFGFYLSCRSNFGQKSRSLLGRKLYTLWLSSLLQRYRRDCHILLDFILFVSLIKKVVMPPGAVTLDDVDLDQVRTDSVLNCAQKGGQSCLYLFFAF